MRHDMFIRLVVTTLFVIAKIRNILNNCPSGTGKMNNDTAIKWNAISPFSETCMDLETVIQSKIS